MIPLKHKWYMSAFKCILSVIWIALFTTQLSYKFYQFSSFSPYSSNKEISQQIHSSNDKALSAFHSADKVFLSLDKRYDLKQLFTMLCPSFRIDPPVARYKDEFNILSLRIISHAPLSTSLRGPPLV